MKKIYDRFVDLYATITGQKEEFTMAVLRKIKPAEVKSYLDLRLLAQNLCDEPNNIDGILILQPNDENRIFLHVCTEANFGGIDNEALGGKILEILDSSSETFVSYNFDPGRVKSIIYEFDNVAFVVYDVRGEKVQDVLLVLVNVKDKDLGAFNANRGRVRASMEVAIKQSGLLLAR